MADISKIKLPNGTTYDIKAKKTICPIYTKNSSNNYSCNLSFDDILSAYTDGCNIVPMYYSADDDACYFGSGAVVKYSSTKLIIHIECFGVSAASPYASLVFDIEHTSTTITCGSHLKDYQQKILDSDWIELPLQTTSTNPIGVQAYTSDYKPKYRKIGHVVELEGIVKVRSQVSASNADSTFKIGTLPSEFRPPRAIRFFCAGQGSSMEHWVLMIESNGAVTGGRYGTSSAVAITTSKALPFAVTFMV